MNLKDSIANKIYYLILAEVLARDIFIDQTKIWVDVGNGVDKEHSTIDGGITSCSNQCGSSSENQT